MINKDPIYHPKPQRGSRAVQMGQKMTQNGTKNNLKQPQTTKSVFGSFHQFGYPNHYNMNFHTVYGRLLLDPEPCWFQFFLSTTYFSTQSSPKGGYPTQE